VFVGVGTGISRTQIRIASSTGTELPERFVGEVQVRSDSLALGYYGDAAATEAAFQDAWLHTGDLGYVAENMLFVTGRQKDIIIKHGNNLIPSTLEEIVAVVSVVRAGAVAAVGVHSPEL